MSEVKVRTERVDDIPLLVKQQQEMGIAEIIDRIVDRHGHRRGLSIGQMIVGWISYILSKSDHRLSVVEDWAKKRLQTLSYLLGQEVRATDFTDDQQFSVWKKVDK